MPSKNAAEEKIRSTTVIAVRRDEKVAMAGKMADQGY